MPRWPDEDCIKWVELRVREFEVGRENVPNEVPRDAFEVPQENVKKSIAPPDNIAPADHLLSEMDLRIWLASVRDKQSLSDIARAMYPRFWDKSKGKRGNQRAISLVRNAIGRVERFLNRDGEDFRYPKTWDKELNSQLSDLLNRIP
jgi:hypothetical protein